MSRRRLLVAYDISEPKRLRDVHMTAMAYGHPLQYSLFICDLDPMELTRLRWDLGAIIKHDVDRIAIIDIGDVGADRFQFMGVRPRLPTSGPTIV